MSILQLPWVELAIATALIGSPAVSMSRDPDRAYRWGLVFTGGALAFSILAWLAFAAGVTSADAPRIGVQSWLFGRRAFALDELNAPLVPAVALLHFLTATATARAHMRRFSLSWSLAAEAVRLAVFSCKEPWILIGLLSLSTIPPYVELWKRGRPTRVYLFHMAFFVGLLALGWSGVEYGGRLPSGAPWWAVTPLLAAVLVRCGTVPAHCWVTDWFEHASFGIALLDVVPLMGVYAAVRLVLPICPPWVLESIGLISMVSAVYAAGMAVIQRDTRRFFAYFFLSHASLVLIGLEMHNELSLTGSLCLWFSVVLSLGGFGLTIRSLEARFGRLSLADYHGLYTHSPALAVCFLLMGLASVGFPGTLGFVSTEILVDGAIEARLPAGVAVVTAAALNGIAVVRAYLLLFTGTRHVSSVSLGIGTRERVAVLTLSGLVLSGGLFPQPGVANRRRAADQILVDRAERRDDADIAPSTSPREPAPREQISAPSAPAVPG